MGHPRFFLAGGGDLEDDWVYLSSLGLKIDYFHFRFLPLSKKAKLMRIGKQLEEAKLKLAEAVGPMALLMGGG